MTVWQPGITFVIERRGFRCVRTTLNLDDELVRRAAELTGRTEKATLVKLGLQALIAQESARRLTALGGADTEASSAPRARERQ